MTDINVLMALLREQEKAAKAEKADFDTWTEQDVQKMLAGGAEVDRLLRGESSALTPAERAEVDRLTKLAAEDRN